MKPEGQSLVWPARATDPHASTELSADELVTIGGGQGLRDYIVARMLAVAAVEADAPRSWSAFSLAHLIDRVGATVDGGVEVSASGLQLVIAYIGFLEQAAASPAGAA